MTDKYQLGQLAIELGLIRRHDLDETLALSRETGLPVGRVLVMSALMSERDLDNLVRCQTFLRQDMIDLTLAARAMHTARELALPFEDALYQNDWLPPELSESLPLGALLVDARVVSEEQLHAALAQQEKVNLPLGRVLVLSGAISEAVLTAAINAQIMVRDRKLERGQAMQALKETSKRQIPLESFLKSKGFYEMPNRNSPRLGELLRVAGLVSDRELITALEQGLQDQQPIGEVLVASKLVTRTILEAALKLQNVIADGRVRLDQARSILLAVSEGRTFEEALEHFSEPLEVEAPPPQRMSFLSFLENLKQVDERSLSSAFEVAKKNTELIKQILMLGQLTDETSLDRAEECYRMAVSGKLTTEHACIVFEYAQRLNISVADSMKELHWQLVNDEKVSRTESLQQNRAESLSSQQIVAMRDSALQMDARGDHYGAREIFEKLLVELINRDENWYLNCLDAAAQSCTGCRDFEAAERYYRESLRRKRELFGEESMEIAVAIDSLGKLYYFQNRFEEALNCAKEYVRLCGSALGADHPHTACGWQNIASVYYAQKNIRAAAESYLEAVNICRKTLGDQHPTTVRLQKNYEIAQQQLNQAKAAARGVGSISGSWRTISVPIEAELGALHNES